MNGSIENEVPLVPTEEELRQIRKEQTKEKLQVIDGVKELTKEEEE